MTMNAFNLFLGIMSLIALIVFIALYFVKAGYGIFRTASWGVAISNKLAWILMEAPVFVVMCVMWIYSCLLYTSPSPRDRSLSRMPSSA